MTEITHITLTELQSMAAGMYGDMVKAVVDIQQRRMVVDAELHADQELYLLESGSVQTDLWGINLYPDMFGTEDFIEFDSMINIRPRQGNRTRAIDTHETRQQIRAIVDEKIRS